MTLYENGTLELSAAARAAGVSRDRMHRCLQSNGVPVRDPPVDRTVQASGA